MCISDRHQLFFSSIEKTSVHPLKPMLIFSDTVFFFLKSVHRPVGGRQATLPLTQHSAPAGQVQDCITLLACLSPFHKNTPGSLLGNCVLFCSSPPPTGTGVYNLPSTLSREPALLYSNTSHQHQDLLPVYKKLASSLVLAYL